MDTRQLAKQLFDKAKEKRALASHYCEEADSLELSAKILLEDTQNIPSLSEEELELIDIPLNELLKRILVDLHEPLSLRRIVAEMEIRGKLFKQANPESAIYKAAIQDSELASIKYDGKRKQYWILSDWIIEYSNKANVTVVRREDFSDFQSSGTISDDEIPF